MTEQRMLEETQNLKNIRFFVSIGYTLLIHWLFCGIIRFIGVTQGCNIWFC